MTATTMTTVDVVSAIIANLKAYAALVAIVSQDIREANWMGDSFAYPCVRVDLTKLNNSEDSNGNCVDNWFDMQFSVYIFSEGKSSLQCQTLMGLIGQRFQNEIISSADIKSFPLRVIYNPVITDGESMWRGEVSVYGKVYKF